MNGKNIITAINSWAVPVLLYSFGVLKWTDTDLHDLDRLTRRLLTKFRCLHPKSSTIRLYLPRQEGGRGLLNIYNLCNTQILKIRSSLHASNNDLVKFVSGFDVGFTPLDLNNLEPNIAMDDTSHKITEWKQKTLHGKFPNLLHGEHVNKSTSLKWLQTGHLYPETEGFVMAIQDRVIRTKNYEKHILKNDVVDKCRKCGNVGESIEHVMAGCPAISETAYLGRHNQVAKLIHQHLALRHNMIGNATPPFYKYTPQEVLETTNHVLYWDRPILTDKTVDFNRPDLLLIDKKEKKAILIDVSIPLTHNIRKMEVEKKNKYENLAIEIKRLWKLHSIQIFPVVISAEGVISDELVNTFKTLDFSRNMLITSQKVVLLQTCHIVRKFLNGH